MTDHLRVQGRCPACNGSSLFLGAGGHVTCSRLDCPDPTKADDMLHRGRPEPGQWILQGTRDLRIPHFTVHPVTPEMERAATERARQAAEDSERAAAWIAEHSSPHPDTAAVERARALHTRVLRMEALVCAHCGHTWPCPTTRALGTDPAATEATEAETTTRVFAALHHSAEQDVTRVIGLYEQWVKAGPPPLGVSLARWWDGRLVELHDAILPPADEPARTTPSNPVSSKDQA